MKIFTASAAMVPGTWRDAVDTHRVQCDVVIVAASKAAAVEALVSGGTSRGMAESVVKETRLSVGVHNSHVQNMLAAGVLNVDESTALVYPSAQASQPIARVDIAGLPVVAHFRYRGNAEANATGRPYGLYVEAVEQ